VNKKEMIGRKEEACW